MIERYSITASAEKLQERFGVDIPDGYEPNYNAAPTNLLPLVTSATPQGISTFYWGTSPEWAKNKALTEKLVNIRSENIAEKTSLKKALMTMRCIIPADGFYAWKKAGKKTFIPYRFVMKDNGLCSFAGLWDEYEDTDGVEFHTFSIITTKANDLVSPIHERMPAILDKQSEKVWLDSNSTEEELMQILAPYPEAKMSLYSISPRINDVSANVPSLIAPAPPADQHGNLTLFD